MKVISLADALNKKADRLERKALNMVPFAQKGYVSHRSVLDTIKMAEYYSNKAKQLGGEK